MQVQISTSALPILTSYDYWQNKHSYISIDRISTSYFDILFLLILTAAALLETHLESSHLLQSKCQLPNCSNSTQAFAKPHNFKQISQVLMMDQSNNAKTPCLWFLIFSTLLSTVFHFHLEIFREMPFWFQILCCNEFDQRTRFSMELRKISWELNKGGWQNWIWFPFQIFQFQFNLDWIQIEKADWKERDF